MGVIQLPFILHWHTLTMDFILDTFIDDPQRTV